MRRLRPPIVLAYHAVAHAEPADDLHRLVLKPRLFSSQLTMLRRAGYRFVTASDLDGDRPPRPGTAVLTFDDGWLADSEVVAPLLAKAGVKATFFVCPAWFGARHPEVAGAAGALATAADVASLARAGHEIGSHSLMHRDLRTLTECELIDDLMTAKARIEAVAEGPCDSLAYPYGLSNPSIEDAASVVGHRLAFGWGMASEWRATAIPRLPAPPRQGALTLGLKVLGVRRLKR